MRLSTLNPIFYYSHGSLCAVVLDAPDGSGKRLGVGLNYPNTVSYPAITETPYERVADPAPWHNPSDPKPNHLIHNYVGGPDDVETLTVQPVIDATNHGHGTFSITNGDVI